MPCLAFRVLFQSRPHFTEATVLFVPEMFLCLSWSHCHPCEWPFLCLVPTESSLFVAKCLSLKELTWISEKKKKKHLTICGTVFLWIQMEELCEIKVKIQNLARKCDSHSSLFHSQSSPAEILLDPAQEPTLGVHFQAEILVLRSMSQCSDPGESNPPVGISIW